MEFVNHIQVTQLELYDNIPLGELYPESREIFKITSQNQRPYEFPDGNQVVVSFEVSLDRIKIQRIVFSLLEWLGDVGGLLEILYITFSLLYMAFHYQTFEEYLVEKLYRKKSQNFTEKDEEVLVPLEPLNKIRFFVVKAFQNR